MIKTIQDKLDAAEVLTLLYSMGCPIVYPQVITAFREEWAIDIHNRESIIRIT